MRVSRDYAFDLITKLGMEIQRLADEKRAKVKGGVGQASIADRLWDLKKALEYRDRTPKEIVQSLHRLVERSDLVSDHSKELLREIAV